MERRGFIKQCGVFGASCFGLSVLLDSCTNVHHINAVQTNNRLQINKSEFIIQKENETSFRKYLIVHIEKFDYPIVLYRFSDTDYKALLLSCTHQGNELNVNGDIITCAAHNSEFSNKGEVVQGPAEKPLKAFPVNTDEKNIYIQLV